METQGGHKVGEKIPGVFQAFSRAMNLLFHRLSQQKVNVIMTFVKGHSHQFQQYNRSPPHSDQIFEWRTKDTLFVTIFPWGCTEIPENSVSSCSEKSLSIPGFPGLWPPWRHHHSFTGRWFCFRVSDSWRSFSYVKSPGASVLYHLLQPTCR